MAPARKTKDISQKSDIVLLSSFRTSPTPRCRTTESDCNPGWTSQGRCFAFPPYANMMLQKEGHSLRERKTSLLSLAPSTVKTWYSYSVQMPKLSGWSCIHSDCIRLNTFVNNIYIHLWSLWFQAWRKVRIHAITHIHLWTSELILDKWKGTL